MHRISVILSLVVSVYSVYGYERIVGGKDANIQNYNYQLSLQLFSAHRCGASLVGPNVAVTAAHCVHGYTQYLSQFVVRAGSSVFDKGGQTLGLKDIHEDKRYNPQTYDYDVAVLILNGSFKLGKEVGIIALAAKDSVIGVGTVSTVTGWGATKVGGGSSKILQWVEIPNVSWNDCKSKYPENLTKRMTCWGYAKGGKDACQGDSGGPLVINNKSGTKVLAGIISVGKGCGKEGYPGIYADVTNSDIYNFISSYL